MNTPEDRPIHPPQVSTEPVAESQAEHRDPITNAPDYHPIGTGLGAAGGGFAAAVTGAIIGGAVSGPAAPIGTVVGAVVGAFAGGYAGKEMAGHHDPDNQDAEHDAYWRERHRQSAYATPGDDYDQDFRPAYQYGREARTQYPGRDFDEVEGDLSQGWDRAKASSQLAWDRARDAAREAWRHADREAWRHADREAWRHADRRTTIDHSRPLPDNSEALNEPSAQGTLDPTRGYNPGFGQTVTDSVDPQSGTERPM